MNIQNVSVYEHRVLEVNLLAKEVLGQEMIVLDTRQIKFAENFDTSSVSFEAAVIQQSKGDSIKKIIKGSGVGFIDACFDAMIKEYEKDFSSLHAISIVDFMVKSDLQIRSKRKSDANVTTLLRVKNADDFEYSFASTSPSLTYSSVSVACSCITFFINAQQAFKKIYFALEDAQKRSRSDLVERYKSQMATLVHATSYEGLVLKLKNEKP